MRRTPLLLLLSTFLIATVFGQSGRKGANPKSTVPPTVSGPVDTTPKPALASKELPSEVDGEHIYKSKETDEHFQILKKPEPSYTREGRRHMTKGFVVLRLILSADETVKHIEVVKGLPDGLTEKAMEVAQKIKFKPAKKDGKPVSVWVEVEYGFYVY
jgi:TonB family protein